MRRKSKGTIIAGASHPYCNADRVQNRHGNFTGTRRYISG